MIYETGESAVPVPGTWIAVKTNEMKNGDNIFHFGSPAVIYNLATPDFIRGFIAQVVAYKNSEAANVGGQLIDVRGIRIDTATGDIDVKVFISPTKGRTVIIGGKEYPAPIMEAGVDPMAFVKAVTVLFVAAGFLGLVLVYVYERADGQVQPGSDPCSGSGLINWLECNLTRSAWITVGVAVGIVLTLGYLIIKSGRAVAA